MSRGFWLQIVLYVFCMFLGAFGARYALSKRARISRRFYRVVLTASVLCFCAGFAMVLVVGRTYPEYYGGLSWDVPNEYKELAMILSRLVL